MGFEKRGRGWEHVTRLPPGGPCGEIQHCVWRYTVEQPTWRYLSFMERRKFLWIAFAVIGWLLS